MTTKKTMSRGEGSILTQWRRESGGACRWRGMQPHSQRARHAASPAALRSHAPCPVLTAASRRRGSRGTPALPVTRIAEQPTLTTTTIVIDKVATHQTTASFVLLAGVATGDAHVLFAHNEHHTRNTRDTRKHRLNPTARV
jgi:hypothetical protein